MQIIVKVNRYIDFLPTSDKPDGSLNFRQDMAGNTLKKTVVEKDTETFISVPDWQIESLMTATRNQGKSKNEVYAQFIEEDIMPAHAPRDSWVKFGVEKDKELEKYLNSRFELNTKKEK